MAALISAGFAFLPGVFFSLFIRKQKTLSTILTDSIVLSLVICSAIFWLPPLHSVRFGIWLLVLYALSSLGLLSLPIALWRAQRPTAPVTPLQMSLRLGTLCVIAFYTLIVLVRANIDWDAINYYIFDAINFVKSNHAGFFFSHWVVPVPNAPNTQPPALPVLYAAAIDTAARIHEQADAAIRLISIVFVLGLWAAVHRLARRYLEPLGCDVASLIVVALPMLASLIVPTPLYLDVAITFLSAAILAEFAFLNFSRRASLRIALYASATILTKITGLGIVVFAAIAFGLVRLPKRVAAAIIAAIFLLFAGGSARLGFFANTASPWLFLAMTATAALGIWGIYRCAAPRALSAKLAANAALVALGLCPGLAFIAELVWLTGSPAGGYIQSVAHVASPHFSWALRMLAASAPYASSIAPGLPQHYGLGLLFWWGLAPVTNLIAIAGLILAIRRASPIVPIGVAAIVYEFAFLTIFRLDDFRHLLPIAPVIAILAAFALQEFTQRRAALQFGGALALVAAAIPFLWIAQETFFTVPYGVLQPLDWTQYFSLSTKSLVNIAIYCAAILWVAYTATRVQAVQKRLSAAWKRYARGWCIPVLCTLAAVTAGFEPVIATACTQGFAVRESAVAMREDGGYIPAVRATLQRDRYTDDPPPGYDTVLSYLGYGISWFSLGALRPFELNDALVLGRLHDEMAANDLPSFYRVVRKYGISSAILPSPGTPAFDSLQRLLDKSQLDAIDAAYDPLLAAQSSYGSWMTMQLYPQSGLQTDGTIKLRLEGLRGTQTISQPFKTNSTAYSALAIDGTAMRDGPDSVRVSITLLQVIPGAALQWVRLQARRDHGSVTIPIATVLQGAHVPPETPVNIRSVAIAGKSLNADFRSRSFALVQRRGGYEIADGATPFILHPSASPIRSIWLSPSRGAEGLELYPATPYGSFFRQDPNLNILLRGSYGCANGSRVTATAKATALTSSGTRALSYSVSGTIPGVLSMLLNNASKLQLDSLVVTGASPSCRVTARIDPKGFSLQQVRQNQFIVFSETTDPMALEQVSLRLR